MKICIIGDPHGSLEKIKQIPFNGVDLILINGDLGSANLMREMAFENIKRREQGLNEIKYSPKQKKKAFMEAYLSSMKIINFLKKIAPVFVIFGNVESSNYSTKKYEKKIGTNLPYLYNDLKNLSNVRVINNRIANFEGI